MLKPLTNYTHMGHLKISSAGQNITRQNRQEVFMECPYFKQVYNAGMCLASKISHITGIDEMGYFCFKENYNSCAILNGNRADEIVKGNGYSNASVKHTAYEVPQTKWQEENIGRD